MEPVRTKRVYEPREAADGARVLVMRLWPRGIRKSHVDLWLKELGADRELLTAWTARRIPWSEYRRRYLSGLRKPAARAALEELEALAGAQRVTLLCACSDDSRCHRGLLGRLRARRPSP